MATVEAPTRPKIRLHEGPFVNEPLTDFTKEENARKMRAAIEKVRGQLGREYDLIIGGRRVKTTDKIKSLNPAKPSQIVGIHQKAGKEHVEPAIRAALAAFESWSQTSFEERASLLFRVGDLLRERKFEFGAWMVFEVSKNWAEADADVAETIDFCEYYSREALRLARTELPVQMAGERDTLLYIPLGVGAVIPPWNFPCAIMAGMTLASIVSGNTVILKPSSDSQMGGKDAIIVDADADIDSAVEGVAVSAFGFQGQKCSACSRAIIDERIYDKFLEKLKARVEKINVGDPAENANMGAVINEGSMKTIMGYIEQGKKDGRVITGGARATNAGEGYFIQPTVVADIPPKSKLEQEEIFGPVLAVIKSKNYDHALQIANDTEFGLTGAVYTRSRDKIERAIREFHVGNLYINRKCTGATVGCHPFGGFNMSGTDSKSGGPDYLYLFTQGKAVGEKIT